MTLRILTYKNIHKTKRQRLLGFFQRNLKPIFILLLFTGIVYFIYFCLSEDTIDDNFSIHIEGTLNNINKHELKSSIEPMLSEGLVAASVDVIKSYLVQNPFVKDVVVKKKWPKKLIINVTEHQIFAILNDNMVLTKQNIVIVPKEEYFNNINDKAYIKFYSPLEKAATLTEVYSNLNSIINKYKQDLDTYTITKLTLASHGSYSLVISDLNTESKKTATEINLGSDNMISNLENSLKLLIKLQIQNKKISYLDARYLNGIAVRA